MNSTRFVFLFLWFLFPGCDSDDGLVPGSVPPEEHECTASQILNDSTTGFLIFNPTNQDEARATGTKINEQFTAGADLSFGPVIKTTSNDSLLSLRLTTTWPGPNATVGEVLSIIDIPYDVGSDCFELTDNRISPDSIHFFYYVADFDIPILYYDLDPTFDNRFFLDSINRETGYFMGRFSARVIADTALLPDLPQVVDFIDVQITAQ